MEETTDKLKQLFEELINETLSRVILSNPRHREEGEKITVRPVEKKGALVFQETLYKNGQVFHKNLEKESLCRDLLSRMEQEYRQLELDGGGLHVTVLVSKKGRVTIKKKQKDCLRQEPLPHNRKKQYILEEGKPVPFLVDLGVMTREGKIINSRYDKFRQINRFLEFIRDVLPKLPVEQKLTIVDFGCGKSYLTFAMYYYLKILNGRDVQMIGLDLKKDVIDGCSRLAGQYGYEGLKFIQGDIADYKGVEQSDMVVTLHACDTATDYALARAVAWKAKVILPVPCCQHQLNREINCDLLEPVLQYGIIRERMAALFTDGMRAELLEAAGYQVQLLEFIDMEHTPKNILIRAVYTGAHEQPHRLEKYQRLKEFLKTAPMLEPLLQQIEGNRVEKNI